MIFTLLVLLVLNSIFLAANISAMGHRRGALTLAVLNGLAILTTVLALVQRMMQ